MFHTIERTLLCISSWTSVSYSVSQSLVSFIINTNHTKVDQLYCLASIKCTNRCQNASTCIPLIYLFYYDFSPFSFIFYKYVLKCVFDPYTSIFNVIYSITMTIPLPRPSTCHLDPWRWSRTGDHGLRAGSPTVYGDKGDIYKSPKRTAPSLLVSIRKYNSLASGSLSLLRWSGR